MKERAEHADEAVFVINAKEIRSILLYNLKAVFQKL